MSPGDGASSSPFDQSSQKYLESAVFTQGPDLERIGDWLSHCSWVLDVGAGTLHTAGHLSERGVESVIGLDPSLAMLRDGRARYESVRAIAGQSERLPFGTDSFDGLVCRYAAHHFDEPESFFREAKRVLTSGASLVFQDLVIAENDEFGEAINEIAQLRDPTHRAYRTPSNWETILVEAGFSVGTSEQFTLPLTYDDWIERSDPPPESRRRIEERFGELSDTRRRRINLEFSDGRPVSFEYPVLMYRCEIDG